MNIYVGNLPYTATDEELLEAFAAYGQVSSAVVIKDRETQRSRGFGFVEMANDDEARAAMEAMNGADLGGRSLVVNEARPRKEGGGRRGGGGGRRGGQRRGGGGGGGYRGGGGRSSDYGGYGKDNDY
jgi:RNA recognition motif-containing protein